MQFVPAKNSFQGAEYVVVPCVLCLMPFSCLWAGTISSANGQGCDEPTRIKSSPRRSSSKVPFAKIFSSTKSNSPDDTDRNLSGVTEVSHPEKSAKGPLTSNHLDKLYPELREDERERIAVTQTYTVHSDQTGRNDSTV